MKPLNSKERTRAFYKVVSMFIFCFSIAMLLGFSTMSVNKMADYSTRKQLEALKNDLVFQEKIFQPNIDDATKKLKDLSNYKEKTLDLNATKSDIETSLKNIMSVWKVDEESAQYLMYKNVLDVYFALESAYDGKFKLEEQLEATKGVNQSVDYDLQRVIDRRDELEKENKILKSEKENSGSNLENMQGQNEKLQNQLIKCRDSLKICMYENKGYIQQIKKLKTPR
jgi:hypothetical protein